MKSYKLISAIPVPSVYSRLGISNIIPKVGDIITGEHTTVGGDQGINLSLKTSTGSKINIYVSYKQLEEVNDTASPIDLEYSLPNGEIVSLKQEPIATYKPSYTGGYGGVSNSKPIYTDGGGSVSNSNIDSDVLSDKALELLELNDKPIPTNKKTLIYVGIGFAVVGLTLGVLKYKKII